MLTKCTYIYHVQKLLVRPHSAYFSPSCCNPSGPMTRHRTARQLSLGEQTPRMAVVGPTDTIGTRSCKRALHIIMMTACCICCSTGPEPLVKVCWSSARDPLGPLGHGVIFKAGRDRGHWAACDVSIKSCTLRHQYSQISIPGPRNG